MLIRILSILLIISIFVVPSYAIDKSVSNNKEFETKTMFVVIDEPSMANFGRMPVNRKIYADVIRYAKEAGARAVAVKFFLDTPSESDELLAKSMDGFPVLLQFMFTEIKNDGPPSTGNKQHTGSDADPTTFNLMHGDTLVWPVSKLAERATNIGFVQARVTEKHDRIESFAINQGNGQILPSLQLAIAETALGNKATFANGHMLLAGRQFELDEMGRIKCPYTEGEAPTPVSIQNILLGKLPASALKNKMIVVGYLGQDSPTVKISATRSLSIHDYFYRQVLCLVHPNSQMTESWGTSTDIPPYTIREKQRIPTLE